MIAIQPEKDSFPMDLAMKLSLAKLVKPEMFKDPTEGLHLTFENILKTEILEAKNKEPHIAAHYYVAVHFRRAMRWEGKGKLRQYVEKRIRKEELMLLSQEFIVVTREDIFLPPDEVIRGMRYKFHANVLLLKRYTTLTNAMNLPLSKYMTEKQKAAREAKRLAIFHELKSLFQSNGILLFFLQELEKK